MRVLSCHRTLESKRLKGTLVGWEVVVTDSDIRICKENIIVGKFDIMETVIGSLSIPEPMPSLNSCSNCSLRDKFIARGLKGFGDLNEESDKILSKGREIIPRVYINSIHTEKGVHLIAVLIPSNGRFTWILIDASDWHNLRPFKPKLPVSVTLPAFAVVASCFSWGDDLAVAFAAPRSVFLGRLHASEFNAGISPAELLWEKTALSAQDFYKAEAIYKHATSNNLILQLKLHNVEISTLCGKCLSSMQTPATRRVPPAPIRIERVMRNRQNESQLASASVMPALLGAISLPDGDIGWVEQRDGAILHRILGATSSDPKSIAGTLLGLVPYRDSGLMIYLTSEPTATTFDGDSVSLPADFGFPLASFEGDEEFLFIERRYDGIVGIRNLLLGDFYPLTIQPRAETKIGFLTRRVIAQGALRWEFSDDFVTQSGPDFLAATFAKHEAISDVLPVNICPGLCLIRKGSGSPNCWRRIEIEISWSELSLGGSPLEKHLLASLASTTESFPIFRSAAFLSVVDSESQQAVGALLASLTGPQEPPSTASAAILALVLDISGFGKVFGTYLNECVHRMNLTSVEMMLNYVRTWWRGEEYEHPLAAIMKDISAIVENLFDISIGRSAQVATSLLCLYENTFHLEQSLAEEVLRTTRRAAFCLVIDPQTLGPLAHNALARLLDEVKPESWEGDLDRMEMLARRSCIYSDDEPWPPARSLCLAPNSEESPLALIEALLFAWIGAVQGLSHEDLIEPEGRPLALLFLFRWLLRSHAPRVAEMLRAAFSVGEPPFHAEIFKSNEAWRDGLLLFVTLVAFHEPLAGSHLLMIAAANISRILYPSTISFTERQSVARSLSVLAITYPMMAFHQDRQFIAVGSPRGALRLFDVKHGQAVLIPTEHDGPVAAVALNGAGDLLFSYGYKDGVLKISQLSTRWRALKAKTLNALELQTLEGEQLDLLAIQISAVPNGVALLRGSSEQWLTVTLPEPLTSSWQHHSLRRYPSLAAARSESL